MEHPCTRYDDDVPLHKSKSGPLWAGTAVLARDTTVQNHHLNLATNKTTVTLGALIMRTSRLAVSDTTWLYLFPRTLLF
jgi:hypothetical protein